MPGTVRVHMSAGNAPCHFPRAGDSSKGLRSPAGPFLQRPDRIAAHLEGRRSQWWEVERWLGTEMGYGTQAAAEYQLLSSSEEKEHPQAKELLEGGSCFRMELGG